jgi:hypothetical protein
LTAASGPGHAISTNGCHCEERSDEAIQLPQLPHWIASLRS